MVLPDQRQVWAICAAFRIAQVEVDGLTAW